jgi:trimeric autotransporter adhesin
MRYLLFFFFLIIYTIDLNAQEGVGINDNGNQPDASAILDVSSNSKGVLVPRLNLVSTSNMSPVSSPAVGLLVFNLATVNDVSPGFYY